MKNFLIVVLVMLFFSCESSYEVGMPNLEGHYSGTFERNGKSSNVELKLENQQFAGISEVVKYPAICRGDYSISGETITFENECIWTAEFDWTLILSGTWNYVLADNTLILTKSNGDRYILTEQE